MSTLAVANISGLAIGAPVNFLVTPMVPTASVGDSSNKVANTNFVMSAITAVSSGFSFTLGASTVSVNDTVNSISSVSLDNCPIGSVVPSTANFSTSYAVAATGNVIASRTAVYAANGTVSAPSFAFGDEVNGGTTGFYKPTTGTISVACSGAETFRFVPGAPPQVIASLPSNDNSSAVATTAFVRNLVSSSNAIIGGKRGLRLLCAGSTSIVVSAQELILESDAGLYTTLKNFVSIFTTTSSGLNGLDTGTLEANTWYQLWVIYNPTTQGYGVIATKTLSGTGVFTYGSNVLTGVGTTTRMSTSTLLMSNLDDIAPGTFVTNVSGATVTMSQPCINVTSAGNVRPLYWAPDPVMPSGFTYKARVGSMFISADGTRARAFRQFGDQVTLNVIPGSASPGNLGVCSGTMGNVTTPTYAPVSALGVVAPITARTLLAQAFFSGVGHLMAASNGNYGGYNSVNRAPIVLGYGNAVDVSTITPLDLEGNRIFVTSDQANSGINVAGWYENL